ncbi:MAG: nitroreductase family protein [Bacteroidetes bacterium]|nr:nitroreductase family protein [Bacteroidota bacterium]
MSTTTELFDRVVKERRSVRIYDEAAEWDEGVVTRSLERAVLAPNSSNLQLWEFYRIISPEKKDKVAEMCLGQKAAKTANELIVIVTRKDKWKERSKFIFQEAKKGFDGSQPKKEKLVSDYYNKIIPMLYKGDFLGIYDAFKKISVGLVGLAKPMAREVSSSDMRIVVHKSAALAAQTFMLSVKAEGYDSCPMEGFDSVRVKKFLGLPKEAEINMIIGVGKALPEGIYGPRVRVADEDVIFKV